VPTTEGDYIGFTNEGDIGSISFTNNAERKTAFVGQHADAMPRVGDEFSFNSVVQVVFSIAVQLSTGQFDDIKSNYCRGIVYALSKTHNQQHQSADGSNKVNRKPNLYFLALMPSSHRRHRFLDINTYLPKN